MTEEREPKKREVEMGSGDYREAHVGGRGTYIEGDYYDMRGQASRERQAPPKRNKTQQLLLDWVKNEVESRLKNSLHNRVSILLEKEEDPTQVNPPWAIDVKIGTGQPFRLPSNKTINDIYDREDIRGRLLILGAPGSGKTTTLLQLAQILINRAEEDVSQPIPILLNLSSWKDDKQSIKNWVWTELTSKYKSIKIRKDIAKKWLEDATFIPLLDGLDELASSRQEVCVKALNQFLDSEWSSNIVVCSRSEEYQHLATQLRLNASIVLQPLNQEKIRDYVLRTEGEKLWDIVKNDPSFMNLARTPLLLTIMVISCEKISFYEWQRLESSSKRLSYLFDAYIEMMLGRKYKGKQPIPDKTRHWLGWLAVQLEEQNQTEFLIESMQPYWLKTKKKKLIYRLIFWIIFWVVVGNYLLILGQIQGLFGLNFGVVQLIFGLIVGLIFGLIGLIVGLYSSEIEFKIFPNQGIKESVKNAVILLMPLTAMLIVIELTIQPIQPIIDNYNLNEFELNDVLNVWLFLLGITVILLKGGGLPAIRHFSLRVVLWFSGYIPWNYARFLNYATNRLFLQRVGGGYRFIHRLLQEHFARMWLETEGSLSLNKRQAPVE